MDYGFKILKNMDFGMDMDLVSNPSDPLTVSVDTFSNVFLYKTQNSTYSRTLLIRTQGTVEIRTSYSEYVLTEVISIEDHCRDLLLCKYVFILSDCTY